MKRDKIGGQFVGGLRRTVIMLVALAFVAMPASAMIIFAIILNDTTIQLDVEPSDSIENVKAKIQDSRGIPPNSQRLWWSGLFLEEGRTLADYNLPRGETIMVAVQSSAIGEFPIVARVGDSISCQIRDTDQNSSTSSSQTLVVTIRNESTGETETLTLRELTNNSSLFGSGDTLPLSGNSLDSQIGSGRLYASVGDQLRILYADPYDPADSLASALITVQAAPVVNNAPYIGPQVPTQTRTQDTDTWTVNLTPYQHDTDGVGNLYWTVTDSNLVTNTTMTGTATLQIAPKINQFGTETVTLRLSDGTETVSQQLVITLTTVDARRTRFRTCRSQSWRRAPSLNPRRR